MPEFVDRNMDIFFEVGLLLSSSVENLLLGKPWSCLISSIRNRPRFFDKLSSLKHIFMGLTIQVSLLLNASFLGVSLPLFNLTV